MSDPYASHLSVLQAVLDQYLPKRVLELGAGQYSTPAFLAHPAVEEVVSIEPDKEWRERVKAEFADEKLTVLAQLRRKPQDFDLVFIDNGTTEKQRLAAIKKVLSAPHPVVVIHDADVPAYNQAIADLADEFSILPPNPHTAVIPPCES